MVRLTAAVYIARRAFGITGEIFAALAGRTDGWSIAETRKITVLVEGNAVTDIFRRDSAAFVPIPHGLAVILFSRYAAGKIEEIYFSSEKKVRMSALQKEKAAGSKNEK